MPKPTTTARISSKSGFLLLIPISFDRALLLVLPAQCLHLPLRLVNSAAIYIYLSAPTQYPHHYWWKKTAIQYNQLDAHVSRLHLAHGTKNAARRRAIHNILWYREYCLAYLAVLG